MLLPNPERLAAFERDLARRSVDYRANLRVYEAMYHQARALGMLIRTDPRDGLDHLIRMARVLNSGPSAEPDMAESVKAPPSHYYDAGA